MPLAMGCCWAACSFVPEPFPDQPDAARPDAYSAPVEFQMRVSPYHDCEYEDIDVTVDGVPVAPEDYRFALVRTFPSYQEAKNTPIVVETWYGASPLARWVEYPGVCETCMISSGRIPTPTLERVGLCLQPSGELRLGSPNCRFPWGDGCSIDAFCDPPCYPFPDTWLPCFEGKGCGLVVAVDDPFYGHFDCVPPGSVPIGDACLRGPPGLDTGYDDCAVGGVCIDGVCREVCAESHPCTDGSPCELFPHMRHAFGACRPAD
jgi:hypothetical protein